MDTRRFDSLTKTMATGASRRTVLKGLFGGAALGAGFTLMPRITEAEDGICIEPGESCEMVDGATPCCGSYTCFEALCDNARGCWDTDQICDDQYPCCDESLSCIDGTCQSGGEVDALPGTGSGSTQRPGSAWVSTVAAGGIAAAAALLLRKSRPSTDESIS